MQTDNDDRKTLNLMGNINVYFVNYKSETAFTCIFTGIRIMSSFSFPSSFNSFTRHVKYLQDLGNESYFKNGSIKDKENSGTPSS